MSNRVKMETFGWFLEYYLANKFIGTRVIEAPDREIIGYYGRKDEVATEDIQLKEKRRVIKKGTHYYTRLYPLTGRVTVIKS